MSIKVPALQSFGDNLNVAVIGASGGIGSAVLDHLVSNPNVQRILATSRREPERVPAKTVWTSLDLRDEETIAAAARMAFNEDGLHLVMIATGLLHNRDSLWPEKSWRTINADSLRQAYEINTVGPTLVAKHFAPLLARDRKSVLTALTARVGSIGDNRAGGWHAYRASKAALNMCIKNVAIELQRRNPQSICVGLHPGTVDTPLSMPFQKNVPAKQLFTPGQSATYMLEVLDCLFPHHSGRVIAWDGEEICA